MLETYVRFVRKLSADWVGRLGVALTTASFITFLVIELAMLAGLLHNAYIGLIVYLALPTLFAIGLILIPIGWRRFKRSGGELKPEDTRGGFLGSRLFQSIAALTFLNLVFLGVAASRMLVFMDESHFCGTACHSVMNPEWVTYQDSPHARVKCVECHVGEGFDALLDSKLNGAWQIISSTFDLYERPIPTPVHSLRPSRETCEECHWPDKFYGQRLLTMARHNKDMQSTPRYTTLSIKIDAGKRGPRSGIHWHIADENEVRYESVDDEREVMIWVDVRQPDGSFKRFRNRNLPYEEPTASQVRTMDCVDCHNRATHIYEDPSELVDDRIEHYLIDSSLPFIKREALAAITAGYPSKQDAMDGISDKLTGYYKRNHPEVLEAKSEELQEAIETLQAAYNRNIHHEMNITWNTYPSLIGHEAEGGCFRCHSPDIVDEDGDAISIDCTLCHSILAYDSPAPFAFIQEAEPDERGYRMHEYLRKEFLRSRDD